GLVDESVAAVFVQQPNFFGCVEKLAPVAAAAKAAGAYSVAVINPIATGLLRSPGAAGFDVAVGDGQPLGVPMGYGGPWFGFFATRMEHVRRMPGRLVGISQDAQGRRAFTLTFQTREQHIRREKATSNICTNEALAAITAAVYLSLLGPDGLRAAARARAARAHALAKRLAALPGCDVANDGPFLDRFTLRTEIGGWELRNALLARGIQVEATASHYADGRRVGRDDVIIQCTELTTDADEDALVEAVAQLARSGEKVAAG
ncbi:MAG TPA: glycine dehydrogenase, partial [Candidatus Limnocylindria bacterium]|nr:glycine dehydrogenase [Candidatus Limnocylindria bacterium]